MKRLLLLLLAISFSVVVLWGCLALEQVVVRKAGKDYRTSQQTLARLREQAPPASQPAQPFRSHRPAVS